MGKKKWKEWIYWFTLALAIVFVYKTLDSFIEILDVIKNIIDVLMPFIFAILIAYILYIPARKLESIYKKSIVKIIQKRSRGFSVLSIYIILLVLIIGVIKFIMPSITSSLKDLFNHLPGYYTSAIEYLNNIPEDSILNNININQIISKLKEIDLGTILKIDDISGFAAKGVMGATNFVFNLFVSVIVSIYLLLERTQILEFVKKFTKVLFKRKTYRHLGGYFLKTNEIFYKFLSSQLLDALIIATIISITLSVLNVKYGILLGLLIGILNIIPYFGAIIGVVIAVIITIFTGGISQAVLMTIVVLILQQIDANIINPKIIGNSLKVSPILVIFAVTVGGAYFGFLGMLLAVPIIAMIKILVLDYIEFRNRKIQKEERKRVKTVNNAD